jgi:hypothetical protein
MTDTSKDSNNDLALRLQLRRELQFAVGEASSLQVQNINSTSGRRHIYAGIHRMTGSLQSAERLLKELRAILNRLEQNEDAAQ